MSDFIRKALGMFVEFDETPEQATGGNSNNTTQTPAASVPSNVPSISPRQPAYNGPMTQQDIDKFTKHFEEVFDKANLEGLDYYEFSKTMHALESTLPDENMRIATVYATMKIQGLTKEKILETARHYVGVLEADKAMFEKAASDKASQEIEERKVKAAGLEKKIAENGEMIKKLTQEMADAQANIGTIKAEIVQYDAKISANKGSYTIAYRAMYNKIISDIQKLTTLI